MSDRLKLEQVSKDAIHVDNNGHLVIKDKQIAAAIKERSEALVGGVNPDISVGVVVGW